MDLDRLVEQLDADDTLSDAEKREIYFTALEEAKEAERLEREEWDRENFNPEEE